MQVTKVALLTSPLCFLTDGRLVCYRRGMISVLRDGIEETEFSIPISFRERWLGCSRYTTRLLRLGIRSAISIDNDNLVLSKDNMLYELDLKNGNLSKGWYCGAGIRPLIFTDVKGIDGFEDGIYFGGYLNNKDKMPVNIYRRIKVDEWQVVYSFPQGVINHIHNIVADPYRNCLWVFTGDFDEASAIWKVMDNFKRVECVACNDQKYRGCVVYVLPEGLLYATDAPYVKNYIYLFYPESLELKKVFPMQGSCIYGCKWKDRFVFSSTVEGDGRDESLWDFFFDRKLGAGVVDDYVHLVIGNLQSGFEEIYKEKKDWLSYLFQFGVFKFPAGENNCDTLYFQPMATKKNDLKLMRLMWGDVY